MKYCWSIRNIVIFLSPFRRIFMGTSKSRYITRYHTIYRWGKLFESCQQARVHPFFKGFLGTTLYWYISVSLVIGKAHCLWAILNKYISHVIVTKTIYFVRNCNKRKSTENWLGAKVNEYPTSKNLIYSCSAHWDLSAQGCVSKTLKRGRTLSTGMCQFSLAGKIV